MSKPSVLGCMEDLQHLRWNFYRSIKKHNLTFDFKPNENIDDIKYLYDIDHEYKNLLDIFWGANVKKHLDDKELFSKIEPNDLELMGKSIEFLINNIAIRTDKTFLYKYAFLCYQKLLENSGIKNKGKYHYKLAKYATLTKNYEVGFPHFLECIDSDRLNLEKDFRWVSLIKNKFLSKLEFDKTKNNSDMAKYYFQIASLTDLMNNIIVKADKTCFMERPPTLEDRIKPDELVFFYDELLYCKFFGKPKMELDAEAMNFFLKNEKIHGKKNKDKSYKTSDFIDYLCKKVKGVTPIFMASPPTSIDLERMGEMILFYEKVPFCQVHGKEKIQIKFDNTSQLTKVGFDELMESLDHGIDIKNNKDTKEVWNQLKKYVSADCYNRVLNVHTEQNTEPNSEVIGLFLKSATLYYQDKNPWKAMKEWKPNILFYMAQAALRDVQGKNSSNSEQLENFYYDIMEFFIENNKDNFEYHSEHYKSIFTKSLDFPVSTNSSSFLIKRGKYFAKMGKIASDLGEYAKAEELYFQAAGIFHTEKYPISFYKKLNDNRDDFVIGDDMIAFFIAHALQRTTGMEELELIKDLSFHLLRERKYSQERSKIGSKIDIYHLLFRYFYNNKAYVTCQNFIGCLPVHSLKKTLTPYLEDLSLNYNNIQDNKKNFFDRFSDIIGRIIEIQKKPNEEKMKLLLQEVCKNPPIFTEGQWIKLKDISSLQLKNFYSYLKPFAGIESDAYKYEEYDEYEEKIFDIFDIKDI